MITNRTVTSDSNAEPISLEDMKVFLRVDHNDEDSLIESLIASARDHVEALTGRALRERTYALTLDRFPTSLELHEAPFVEVDSVAYYDSANESQSFSVDNLEYIHQLRTTLKLKPSVSAPSVADRTDAVTITYTAGYGDNAGECPEGLKQAVRFLTAHYYENRSAIGVNVNLNNMPFAVQALCSQYLIKTFH